MERHLYPWLGRFKIVKMSRLLKVIYRFITIPSKNPSGFYASKDIIKSEEATYKMEENICKSCI